jgi:hypothetical protein
MFSPPFVFGMMQLQLDYTLPIDIHLSIVIYDFAGRLTPLDLIPPEEYR